jgi:hypothetical protein
LGIKADYIQPAEVAIRAQLRHHEGTSIMPKGKTDAPLQGRELISLAQKLARDAERHAILSASLASQADRLMVAGLQSLEARSTTAKANRISDQP